MFSIVFLHGFLGNKNDWKDIISFIPNVHCVTMNLPGHNGVPFTENFFIDIPRFHLVGYSMGGRIARMYADRYPEQVASLTLLSTHPGLQSEEEKQARLQTDAEWAKTLLELPIDDFLARWYDQVIFRPFKPDFTMRKNHDVRELAKCMMHYSLAKQPLFAIDHVLVGERDTKFRSLFKNPLVIPHAGHMVHLENPQKVAEIIKERVSL